MKRHGPAARRSPMGRTSKGQGQCDARPYGNARTQARLDVEEVKGGQLTPNHAAGISDHDDPLPSAGSLYHLSEGVKNRRIRAPLAEGLAAGHGAALIFPLGQGQAGEEGFQGGQKMLRKEFACGASASVISII